MHCIAFGQSPVFYGYGLSTCVSAQAGKHMKHSVFMPGVLGQVERNSWHMYSSFAGAFGECIEPVAGQFGSCLVLGWGFGYLLITY